MRRLGKRFLSLALAAVLCLALVPMSALAADPTSGECGKGVTWSLVGGVLNISGTGRMADYNSSSSTPWYKSCRKVDSAVISEGITHIGGHAFEDCTNLTSVTIPRSVTTMGHEVFLGCDSLPAIRVVDGNEAYTSLDGVLYTKDEKTLVAYPGGKQGAYTIPSGVTTIGESAFRDCEGLTGVTIPQGVTEIGGYAFDGCTGLTHVDIPEGVTELHMSLFNSCTNLTSVTIPNGVTYIGGWAFSGCPSLESISIPNTVKSIDQSAFVRCRGLTKVVIPNSVIRVGASMFDSCSNLESVTLSSGITTIAGQMFSLCINMTSVTIPASVTEVDARAFYACHSLTDVYYGGSAEQWAAIKINDNNNDALTSATIHYNSPMPETSEPDTSEPETSEPPIDATSTQSAAPTNDLLNVDGKPVTPAAYKIGNANFFKLRDVAMMLNGTAGQFSVDYDGDLKAVKIVTGQPYSPQGGELKDKPTANATAEISNNAIYINGEKVELTVYKINGQNFFGIRDLGSRLGFNVGWEPGRGMFIESDKPYNPNN